VLHDSDSQIFWSVSQYILYNKYCVKVKQSNGVNQETIFRKLILLHSSIHIKYLVSDVSVVIGYKN
jgi:hypothetical protein